MTTFDDTDTNNNGVIERQEWRQLELEDRRRKMDDEDAKRDSQRKMVWFALSGMVMYPVRLLLALLLDLILRHSYCTTLPTSIWYQLVRL